MEKNCICALALRHCVSNSRETPSARKAAIRLCPGAKSATVAWCSAKGAQTTVGYPAVCEEKSRKRIVGSSRVTWFSVDQVGPATKARGAATPAKRAHCSANSDAISPTDNAASAGHRKAIDGDSGSGIAITLGPGAAFSVCAKSNL